MIEFARHIEVLLLENDCVFIPGLGGFVTHRVPARFVSEENRFLPPYRTLGFSPKMQLNDGLLVQSYMQAYDATYPEAMRLVENKVQEVRNTLSLEGELELHGIGTLRQDINGELNFTPLEAGLLSPNLYGFGSFEMLSLKQLEDKEAQERIAPLQPMQVKTPSTHQEKPKTVIIQMNYTWAASIAAICVGIIFSLLLFLPTPSGDALFAGIKPVSEWFNAASSHEVKVETPVKEVKKAATSKAVAPKTVVKAESQPQPSLETVPVQDTKPTEYFTIVLVSCIPQSNAERFVQEMTDKGYQDTEVLMMNKVRRVTYAHFDSEAQAVSQLRTLRKEDPTFAESWILKVDK